MKIAVQEPQPSECGHDWGAASLALGAVLLIMAPLVVLVIIQGIQLGYPLWNRSELRLAIYLAQVTVSLMLLLCLVALLFGLRGLRTAARRRLALGLPTGGAAVSVMAAFLWIIVALGTVLIAGRMRQLKEAGRPLPILTPRPSTHTPPRA